MPEKKVAITIEQIKAARALLGWTQNDLWHAAKDVSSRKSLGFATIKRLEAKSGVLTGAPDLIESIINALERAGVEFIEHGKMSRTGGEGVRLKRK